MSAIGDENYVRSIRDKLTDAIENEKVILIQITTERRAGHIQGLQDALLLMNQTYRAMTGAAPKE